LLPVGPWARTAVVPSIQRAQLPRSSNDNSIHITMNSGSTTSTSVNYATRPVRQNLVRSADIRANATNTSVAMHAAHGAVAPAVAAPGGAGHATSGAAARSPAQRTKWKPLAQSPPVSRRALIEKKPPAEEEEKLCAICTEPLGAGPFGRLDCSHGAQFHAQCLDKWLRKNPNCPLCRAASPVRSRHRNSSPAERNTPPPRSGGGGGGRSSIADNDVTPPVSPPLSPSPLPPSLCSSLSLASSRSRGRTDSSSSGCHYNHIDLTVACDAASDLVSIPPPSPSHPISLSLPLPRVVVECRAG